MAPFFIYLNMINLFRVCVFTVIVLAVVACKKDEDRDSVIGSWNCEHYSDIAQPATYQANISRSPIIDTLFVISNFHNFGFTEEKEVYCSMNADGDLVIESSFLINQYIVVSGKGEVADDFSQISWSYTVNDGILENVEAIYR